MTKHRDRASAGFMLLEVVIAVAVLGIAFATAFELLAVALRSVTTSGDYTEAVILAKQKLEEISLRELRPGSAQGTVGPLYRWTAEISPEDGEDAQVPAHLFKVHVTVSWTRRGRDRSVELVTLRGPREMEEEKAPVTVPVAPRRRGRR